MFEPDCQYARDNKGDDSYIFRLAGVCYCANFECPDQIGEVVSLEHDSPLVRQCGLSENTSSLEQISKNTGIHVVHGFVVFGTPKDKEKVLQESCV